jgi:hypothetical protein
MLRKLDSFGQPLQLQFQGRDLFKSRIGGTISLLIYMTVIAYAIGKCNKLVTKSDPDIFSTKRKIDLNAAKFMQMG